MIKPSTTTPSLDSDYCTIWPSRFTSLMERIVQPYLQWQQQVITGYRGTETFLLHWAGITSPPTGTF